ncbi:MAG: phenylacetate--CoA ligase family protein [Chlorobium sp.]|nr:phenylacetate--CoA ligase family protein [Chlorobium sp.]
MEQIRGFQWDKLQALIRHAAVNVPYYRDLFSLHGLKIDDIRSFEDFRRIPVLTKSDLQRDLNNMVAEGVDTTTLPLNSTGGSTGVPLNFYQDESYVQWADAARLRAWRYMVGANGNDLEAVFWGAVRDIGKGLTLQQVFRGFLRERALLLNTFDLDEDLLRKYLRYYNFFRPSIVRGYASSLYYVARYIEAKALTISKPKAVISSTEILHSRMRETIERVFGCKVFDSYGCREVSQIATECEAHCGLHIVFENQYVELDGQDIIITNLNNYVMPFIRYKVGDLAEKIETGSCSCGRNSPRVMNLIGRDNDNIELRNGKVINGEFFEFLFFGISSVIQYQVVYDRSVDKLTVKLHLSDNVNDVGNLVRKTMADKFDYANVFVEYDDKFDKTPTGKLRFVYAIN